MLALDGIEGEEGGWFAEGYFMNLAPKRQQQTTTTCDDTSDGMSMRLSLSINNNKHNVQLATAETVR